MRVSLISIFGNLKLSNNFINKIVSFFIFFTDATAVANRAVKDSFETNNLQCAHRLHKVRTYYYHPTKWRPRKGTPFLNSKREMGCPSWAFTCSVVVCADLVKSMSALQTNMVHNWLTALYSKQIYIQFTLPIHDSDLLYSAVSRLWTMVGLQCAHRLHKVRTYYYQTIPTKWRP